MKSSPIPVTPLKTAVEELDFLRQAFHVGWKAYGSSVEGEIAKLREIAAGESARGKLPAALIRDARDMVILIRTLEIKPEKGRRRDLKKIEATVEDLKRIVENWGV
jgi:hypothetical protein